MPGQVDGVLSFSLIEILLFRLIEFLFQPDKVYYVAVLIEGGLSRLRK